jgi:Alpha/beta hydrolase domain containing 18
MHLLDFMFGLAARGPRFFQDGWGDRALCEAMDPVALAGRRIPRLVVELGAARREHGGLVHEGTFASPEVRLPPCARTARIRLLLPERGLRAVALHLAASGDQGFGVRARFAAPLLERGIGALVLENAYYGARRPANQPRHAFRSISDLHLMGAATFQEGRALLRWAKERLRVLVGVTGYSMGGQLSAMVGASLPFPCAVVPVAAPCSPASVLREGVLHHVAEWEAIAGRGGHLAAARQTLCEHLARFAVTSLPPPFWSDAAIVVGTRDDGVVPPADQERIARHWGAELRWLPAGHVSAVFRHQGDMRQAIADAFDRLEAATALRSRSGHARRRAAGSARQGPGAPASAAARARAPGRVAGPRT